MTTTEKFERFNGILEGEGIRASLAYLLGLTDYRFISIFRFDGNKVRSVVHHDIDTPDVLETAEEDIDSTYCCYVRDTRGIFTTANALLDDRLGDHTKRATLSAYCGFPVMDPAGHVEGTLCHYDVVPRNPGQIDMELMLLVCSTLQRSGKIPAYPAAK